MPFIGYIPPHDAHLCRKPFWALFLRRRGTVWQCKLCKKKWIIVNRYDTISGSHYRDWDRLIGD